MKVQEIRKGIFRITAAANELSLLVAGARMSLALMQKDPQAATDESRLGLEKVLSDFDRAMGARRQGDD